MYVCMYVECETKHTVISYANTSNATKIPTFFGLSWGMILHLSNMMPLYNKPIPNFNF